MKPVATLLAVLVTAASAATLPRPQAPTRPRDAPQHRLALLHTLTPSAPPGNVRLLAAGAEAESTKGGAILVLPNSSSSSSSSVDKLKNGSAPISSAQAAFRVPVAQMPTSGPTANNPVGEYAASFWVGIDAAGSDAGSGCEPLRAGVDVFYDGTLGGTQGPFAWYQLGSGPATGFGGGFGVAAGDLVRFTLSLPPPPPASSASSSGLVAAAAAREVVVLAENFGGNVSCAGDGTLGGTARPVKTARQVLPLAEGVRVCGREAAWLVEDFPLEGRPEFPVALANFTSVTFGGAGVALADGSRRDVAGAQVLDVRLQAQGGRLTSCELVGGKKVKCTRVVGDN